MTDTVAISLARKGGGEEGDKVLPYDVEKKLTLTVHQK
jgi:hypothetical protein